MHRTLVSIVVALVLAAALPAAAQDPASQLVGVWAIKSNVEKETATGKEVKQFGDAPHGFAFFTKGGHYAFVQTALERKGPAGAQITDAERAALYATMVAVTGTYKVDGNKATIVYNTSWNQIWTGTTQTRFIEIVGNKLTWSGPPRANVNTGTETAFVITMERAE
jgi:hypothetical protein